MKVKVQYTVDFDQIPSELQKRFADSMEELKMIYESKRLVKVDEDSMDDFLQSIDYIRRKMYDIDLSLQDYSEISKSFISEKLGISSSEEKND
jgi:hypothetical protein